ncbi:MAG: NifU family protein [Ilumatobacteraceae bacterium]
MRSYQSALIVLDEMHHADRFALANMNVAVAILSMPMTQASDQVRLGVAVQSLRAALRVYRPDTHPWEWSSSQMNLANALQYLPSTHREENLQESVELYEEVLAHRSRRSDPVGVARVLANQANALAHLAVWDQRSRHTGSATCSPRPAISTPSPWSTVNSTRSTRPEETGRDRDRRSSGHLRDPGGSPRRRSARRRPPESDARIVADEYAAVDAHVSAVLHHLVVLLRSDDRGRSCCTKRWTIPRCSPLVKAGIVKPSLAMRAIQVLDGVRPYLTSHNGDVELVRIADGVAYVRLLGACQSNAARPPRRCATRWRRHCSSTCPRSGGARRAARRRAGGTPDHLHPAVVADLRQNRPLRPAGPWRRPSTPDRTPVCLDGWAGRAGSDCRCPDAAPTPSTMYAPRVCG